MATGRLPWRNPSIRDLQAYTGFDPALESTIQGIPAPEQWAQEEAGRQFRASTRPGYPSRTPTAQAVRGRLLGTAGPRAQGISGTRYKALQQALGQATPTGTAPAAPRPMMPTAATRPMSIPSGVQNVAPTFAPAPPPTAAGGTGGGGIGPMLSPAGGAGQPAPPSTGVRGLFGKGNFAGRPTLNAAAGLAISGIPSVLAENYGVDFNANPAIGQPIQRFFEGAAAGTGVGGPLVGALAGTANANREVAAGAQGEQRRLVAEATGGNRAADLGIKGFQLGNALVNPIGAAGGVMDAALDKAGDLPVIGGLFGGGDSAEAQPDQQVQQAAAQRAATMTPENLQATMQRVGLNPEYASRLMDSYNQQIALAEANPTAMKLGDKYITSAEFAELDPEEAKKVEQVTLDPTQIQQSAYQQTLASIPQLRAQQDADEAYLTRTTAMQAALQQQIPKFLAPYQQASDQAGALLAGYGGPNADLAQASLNQFNANNAAQREYLATNLALIPGQLAMQQNAQQQQSIANQIQQAMVQQQLATQYPELFGGGGQSSSSDALLAALLEDQG